MIIEVLETDLLLVVQMKMTLNQLVVQHLRVPALLLRSHAAQQTVAQSNRRPILQGHLMVNLPIHYPILNFTLGECRYLAGHLY